ncbi:hypothetical protein TNCV_838051 [Trichonephila clavipes]|nr:hypothetical protein TNCV_838051 [Trichonephila clavipes]
MSQRIKKVPYRFGYPGVKHDGGFVMVVKVPQSCIKCNSIIKTPKPTLSHIFPKFILWPQWRRESRMVMNSCLAFSSLDAPESPQWWVMHVVKFVDSQTFSR